MVHFKFHAGLFLLFFAFSGLNVQGQNPAYRIFTGEGKEVKWNKMIKELPEADVVFFGELHNDPIAHWLELRVMKELSAAKKEKFVAGAEMFETDQQLILDEYLDGLVDDTRFEEGTRLWKNYKTDYKPLLSLAKDSGIHFVATNIPRRYANLVSKGGFEVLEELEKDAKALIAPIPVKYDPEVPAYKKMMEMTAGHGMANDNFPKAQAMKDATMAHFILKNLPDGYTFLHFNGAYHSDFHDGIIWYLRQSGKKLDIITISTVLQEDLDKLEVENEGKADFIIVIPWDMTRTY